MDRSGRILQLERAVLTKDDNLAGRNRAWLAGRHVVTRNLVSAFLRGRRGSFAWECMAPP
jgi:hypothetical protein